MRRNRRRQRRRIVCAVLLVGACGLLLGSGLLTGRHIIDAPYIYQAEDYPTGCESVSAVMALQYLGERITPEYFIDELLPKGAAPHENENGSLVGADPNEVFLGNPYSQEGWGCYAPVIMKALKKGGFTEKYKVEQPEEKTLQGLCDTYIQKNIPVIVWATINMETPRQSKTWTVEESGKSVTWQSPMHCLLLVGSDSRYYYFNDPMEHKAIAYPKGSAEAAYNALGRQAIVIGKK